MIIGVGEAQPGAPVYALAPIQQRLEDILILSCLISRKYTRLESAIGPVVVLVLGMLQLPEGGFFHGAFDVLYVEGRLSQQRGSR